MLVDDLKEYIIDRYASESLSDSEMKKIVNQIALIPAAPLYNGNRETFWLINEGFDLVRDDISKVALHIDYIDYEHPENNIFKVVNQYSVQDIHLRRFYICQHFICCKKLRITTDNCFILFTVIWIKYKIPNNSCEKEELILVQQAVGKHTLCCFLHV